VGAGLTTILTITPPDSPPLLALHGRPDQPHRVRRQRDDTVEIFGRGNAQP